MISGFKDLWNTVEKRNVNLFYIAGGLKAIFALEIIVNQIGIADVLTLSFINLGGIIWSPLSSILAFIAVLGLFPVHTNRAPRSARHGVVFLGIAIVLAAGFSVGNTLTMIGETIGIRLALPFVDSELYLLVSLVSYLGTYLLFSYAVFETDSYPGALGYVLLIPAFIQLVWLGEHIIGFENIPIEISSWISLALHVMEVLALLLLGYILNNPEKFTNIKIGHYLNRTQHRV